MNRLSHRTRLARRRKNANWAVTTNPSHDPSTVDPSTSPHGPQLTANTSAPIACQAIVACASANRLDCLQTVFRTDEVLTTVCRGNEDRAARHQVSVHFRSVVVQPPIALGDPFELFALAGNLSVATPPVATHRRLCHPCLALDQGWNRTMDARIFSTAERPVRGGQAEDRERASAAPTEPPRPTEPIPNSGRGDRPNSVVSRRDATGSPHRDRTASEPGAGGRPAWRPPQSGNLRDRAPSTHVRGRRRTAAADPQRKPGTRQSGGLATR